MDNYFHLSPEKRRFLPFGSVQPAGWLRAQMQRDLDGFVGNLDQLVPSLMNDPIYGMGRLSKQSPPKVLGNAKEGDAEGDAQYQWWNSETQSNWWDGFLRQVLMLDDNERLLKVQQYIHSILATQDEDGYLGIYDPELRYQFDTENGELWSKATLCRGLLAYYEYTKEERVFEAVCRAVENVFLHYPIYASSPFRSGSAFNGGVSHGLAFTDVLERLYYHTQLPIYREYALFLYQDYSTTHQSEADGQLGNLLKEGYRFKSHGVHTFEQLRALIIARYSTQDPRYPIALERYLHRIQEVTTLTGGAVGDEWIEERVADATHTGYEYCSLQELLDSYCLLLQKTGEAALAEQIERLFYNAAQGARHPEQSCIAYLKTDNSFEMLGTRNGWQEPNRQQTRYKYSAVHQEVAVCCSPNAGRISPYFVQNAWMLEGKSTLVATLLMPNVLRTTLLGQPLCIENQCNYPFDHHLRLIVTTSAPLHFTLKIRQPAWATQTFTKERYHLEDGYLVFDRLFSTQDVIELSWEAEVEVKRDPKGASYYSYGALLYALPITAKLRTGKTYSDGFTDLYYEPLSTDRFAFLENEKASFESGKIRTQLLQNSTGQVVPVELIPIGKTILRQLTF
jgi:DUF1680 family protein